MAAYLSLLYYRSAFRKIPSSIFSDVVWNIICTISGLETQYASWFTWKHTHNGVDQDAIEVQRALGFPNLKLGPKAVAARGFPNVPKSLEVMAARGWPNLKKGLEIQAVNGWSGLKKARQVHRALGFPGVKKSLETRAAGGWAGLKKGRETQAANGWVGPKKAAALKSALAQEVRQAKLLALLGSLEIREPPNLDQYQGQERRNMAKVSAKWKDWEKMTSSEFNKSTMATLLSNHAIWYHSTKAPFGARFQGDGGPPYNEVEYTSRKNPAISWYPVKVADREAWVTRLRRDVSNE